MPQQWGEVEYQCLSNEDDPARPLSFALLDDLAGRVPNHSDGPGPLTPVVDVGTVSLDGLEAEKDDSSLVSNPADGPPPLRYPIETKHKSIFITWSIIILVNTILPVTIYYGLRYITHSSTDFILNVCQIPMTPILFQFPYRLWQLKRRGAERSPRHRGPLTWDFFQWQFLFGALVTTAVCVLASTLESYTVFALAVPVLFSEVCLQLLLFDILARFKFRQPCRISSVPKGAPFRPGVYYMVEDVTAVDGGGGMRYRDRLAKRWEASPPFQRLIGHVGLITGFSGMLMVGIEFALILMTPVELFFGASWVILWLWAALTAYFCISYTKACLRSEKAWWKEEMLPLRLNGPCNCELDDLEC